MSLVSDFPLPEQQLRDYAHCRRACRTESVKTCMAMTETLERREQPKFLIGNDFSTRFPTGLKPWMGLYLADVSQDSLKQR
jgi:hypothetical protein